MNNNRIIVYQSKTKYNNKDVVLFSESNGNDIFEQINTARCIFSDVGLIFALFMLIALIVLFGGWCSLYY
jgi:hypothetical protein